MSGPITIVVRDQERVRTVSGWTSALPHLTTRRAFIEQNPKLWDLIEPFDENSHLAPIGYGLFVVDHISSTLLHMQGAYDPCFLQSMYFEDRDPFYPSMPTWPDPDIVWLISQNRVKITRWKSDEDFEDREVFPLSSWAEGNHSNNTDPGPYKFPLDLSPWKVERFEESSEGALSFRTRLLELGFVLGPGDEIGWENWVQKALLDEAEGETNENLE